jgi:hypothetical protein
MPCVNASNMLGPGRIEAINTVITYRKMKLKVMLLTCYRALVCVVVNSDAICVSLFNEEFDISRSSGGVDMILYFGHQVSSWLLAGNHRKFV